MLIVSSQGGQKGVSLANSLGLPLNKREGQDLVGPCVECQSSDAFRLHMHTGVAHCFSCDAKWSPFQLAEAVTGDLAQAKELMVELGIFQPGTERNGRATNLNPIEVIGRQKGVTPDSLQAFGANATKPNRLHVPCYGPDGSPCSTFYMFVTGGKGLFAKGKPAGLFFPHIDGRVQLPQPGEVWHLVEGVKDAAALHKLGLLACGLNTCRLAAKFARLFAGVEIVLVPDRDRAGEEGAQTSARVLRGIAKSTRVAVLPAEFKETKGDDVRDVLRQSGGRELVMQAITDVRVADCGSGERADEQSDRHAFASAELELPESRPLKLAVWPAAGKTQRLVVATQGDVEHRDRLDTDSSISRGRFLKKLAGKLGIDCESLGPHLEPQLTKLADKIDATVELSNSDSNESQSQATLAANMAVEWDLWHTPGKDAYATIPIDGHLETWPARSQTFRRFLAMRFYEEQGKAMNSEALSAAVNLIEAKALFKGQTHEIHVRVAEHDCHPEPPVDGGPTPGERIDGESVQETSHADRPEDRETGQGEVQEVVGAIPRRRRSRKASSPGGR